MTSDNELIISSYKSTLKELRRKYKVMDSEHPDKTTTSAIISSMEYSLFWLKNGYERPPIDSSITKLSKDKREELWGEIEQADGIVKGMWDIYSWEETECDKLTDKQLERMIDVEAIINRFSNQELNVFILNHQSYLSTKEIASELNITEKAVHSTVNKIRNKIKKGLEFQNTEICLFA